MIQNKSHSSFQVKELQKCQNPQAGSTSGSHDHTPLLKFLFARKVVCAGFFPAVVIQMICSGNFGCFTDN